MDTPYAVLGIAKNADLATIKSAYRSMAKRLHPDLHPNDPDAVERFQKVNAAYKGLLSEKQNGQKSSWRASSWKKPSWGANSWSRHARNTHNWARNPQGKTAQYGRASPFTKFFRKADPTEPKHNANSHGANSQGANSQGVNSDSAQEKKHEDILFRPQERNFAAWVAQFAKRTKPDRGRDMIANLSITLPEAALGTQKRLRLPSGHMADCKIPPATQEGATLRLKSHGKPGQNGEPAGDALIRICVDKHPFFRREENGEIHLDLPITMPEAVLGAQIFTPTLHGFVTVNIPPQSNSGLTLRIPRQGAPRKQGRGFADQVVHLQIVLPREIDQWLHDFMLRWNQGHKYDPRAQWGMSQTEDS